MMMNEGEGEGVGICVLEAFEQSGLVGALKVDQLARPRLSHLDIRLRRLHLVSVTSTGEGGGKEGCFACGEFGTVE